MELNEKILTIYPELKGSDCSPFNPFPPYRIQDDSDGKGAYIKEWNYIKEQPTQKQLKTMDTE